MLTLPGGARNIAPMMRFVAAFVLVLIAGGCATERSAMRALTRGTCAGLCESEHEESLYDLNQCLDDCSP